MRHISPYHQFVCDFYYLLQQFSYLFAQVIIYDSVFPYVFKQRRSVIIESLACIVPITCITYYFLFRITVFLFEHLGYEESKYFPLACIRYSFRFFFFYLFISCDAKLNFCPIKFFQLGFVQKYLSSNITYEYILSFLFAISFCDFEILVNSDPLKYRLLLKLKILFGSMLDQIILRDC